MRSILVVAGLLLLPAAQAQDIYKWVDKDGVVHYSDQPGSPDAKQVHVSVPSASDSGDYQPPPEDASSSSSGPLDTGYRGLMVVSPAQNANYFGTDVRVPVAVRLDGELRPDDSVTVYLDGAPAPGVTGMSGDVTGLSRGSHTIRAAVRDLGGREVISSGTVTFYVQQTSTAKPPVGPALRPPPKPAPRPVPHTK
jgi:hypothetical protein